MSAKKTIKAGVIFLFFFTTTAAKIVAQASQGPTMDVTSQFISGAITNNAHGTCPPPGIAVTGVTISPADIFYLNGATITDGQLTFSFVRRSFFSGTGLIGVSSKTFASLVAVSLDLKSIDPSHIGFVSGECGLAIKLIGANGGQNIGHLSSKDIAYKGLVDGNVLIQRIMNCNPKDDAQKSKSACQDTSSAVNEQLIYFPDQNMAQRTARAIQHAIILSGGTTSAF